jgi:uncharacterized protein (DUF433 family)
MLECDIGKNGFTVQSWPAAAKETPKGFLTIDGRKIKSEEILVAINNGSSWSPEFFTHCEEDQVEQAIAIVIDATKKTIQKNIERNEWMRVSIENPGFESKKLTDE